jgi:hypothetical protein
MVSKSFHPERTELTVVLQVLHNRGEVIAKGFPRRSAMGLGEHGADCDTRRPRRVVPGP